MLRESDLIIVHTQELKKRLEFINPKIEVIRHGVTNARFALDPLEAKRRIGIPELMVSQIGFLFNHKGVQNFIKAVAQIDVTALIAGSGPDETAVRRLADLLCPGKIIFRPYLSKEEYPLYIAASDIVVFPRIHSQGECSGVLVQAMAAGKAIVAHDIGCYKEYLSNHRGILTKLEDISALQAAILDLIHHDKKRRQLGRGCQEFSRQRLEWDTIAEQHLQLYEGLIKKRK
jgi:glycosyltransferase involved in cell wall biosynthesis